MDQQNQKALIFLVISAARGENFNLCPCIFSLSQSFFSYDDTLAFVKIASNINVNNGAGKEVSKFQDVQ